MRGMSRYERETLLLRLGIPKEDKFSWECMDDLLIERKYKKFLEIVVRVSCQIRDEQERIEEENDD